MSESTGTKNSTPSERGHWAELKVAQDRCQTYFEEIVYKNWIGPFGELDLVTKGPRGEIYIIEVKCRREGWQVDDLISERQLRRLRLNQTYLDRRMGIQTELLLAYVSWPGFNIEYFAI